MIYRLSIFIISLALTSCAVIPLGSDTSIAEIQKIQPGKISKTDIIKMYGTPDILDRERFSVYSLRSGKSLVWFHYFADVYAKETYNVAIGYDQNGIVDNIKYEARIKGESNNYTNLNEVLSEYSYKPGTSTGIIELSTNGGKIGISKFDKITIHETEGSSLDFEFSEPGHVAIAKHGNTFATCAYSATDTSTPNDTIFYGTPIQKQNSSVMVVNNYKDSNKRTDIAFTDCRNFFTPASNLTILGFSPDSSTLAASQNKTINTWSIEDKTASAHYTSEDKITSLRYSPDGKFLTYVGKNSTINILSASKLKFITSINRKSHPINTSFSDDGKYFAIASKGHIEIWERNTDTPEQFNQHNSEAWPYTLLKVMPKPAVLSTPYRGDMPTTDINSSLHFSSDGNFLLHSDWLTYLWDIKSGELIAKLGTGFDNLKNIKKSAFYKGNHLLLVGHEPSIFSRDEVTIWILPLDLFLKME